MASERPQIGSRLARVARSSSSRSVFAFGSVRSWGITLAAGVVEAERADAPRWCVRDAVVAGEVHAVDRERGRVVGDEHAVGSPLRAASRRPPS